MSAACSGGGSAKATLPHATIATAPETTTTTNAYAVPTVIDAAYINRILAGIDATFGDLIRTALAQHAVTAEAIDRMKALFSGPVLTTQLNLLTEEEAGGFRDLKPNPGNRSTKVVTIVTALADCVYAHVSRDYSAVAVAPSAALTDQYVGLNRASPGQDPNHYNPTGWTVVYDGFLQDHSQPPDPCSAA
ncbi:MAG: hypothetical protein ABR511_13370 [Acidimicrobiales bacterium]